MYHASMDVEREAGDSHGMYKWGVVGMLWCVVLLNYADRQALSGTLPLISRDMHLAPHQQGMLGAAFAWVYGLCSPFAGRIVDRVRRSSAVLTGLHVWSAICAVTAFAPNFGSLLALRAGEGLGETAYFPASVSLISEYHGDSTRSRALAIHQTGVYVGIVGGTTAAGLIGQRFGWRASFAVFGILGIVLGLVLRFSLHDRSRDVTAVSAPPPISKVAAELASGKVVCLVLAFICANGVASVLFVWLPTYVHERFRQDLAVSGFSATAFAQAGSLVGALAGGYLADKAKQRMSSGRIVVQAAGLLLGIPFVVASGVAGSLAIAVVAFAGWGICKGLYEANIWASLFDVTPREMRGTVVGVTNMAGWLFGAGTAPIAVGYLAEHASLGVAIASTALLYIFGAALLAAAAVLRQPERTVTTG